MTRDMWWSVRVSCDDELASGFLVAPDQVLTCDHVIEAYPDEAWTVTFPGADADRTGRVSFRADDADVAVLTLDRPVGVAPVRLAPFHTIDTGRDLCAYGFPQRTGGWEQVMLKALPGWPGDGRRQVQTLTDSGHKLVSGFSGGPVYDVRTRQVVGMVAEADPHLRSGRIVPVSELCRAVPGLAERIHLGEAFPAPAYTGLVTLLERADAGPGRLPSLLDGLTACSPEPPPASALAQIEYLATEDPRPVEAIQIAVVAALKRVDAARPDLAADVDEWIRRYFLTDGTARARETIATEPDDDVADGDPPWVLVMIDLSASPRGGYLVQGWCVFGPTDCRSIGAGQAEVTEAGLPEHVVDLVEDGLSRIPAVRGKRRPVVEFVLKRRLILDAEVDRWGEHTDASAPLGWDYPVVVRDLNSFRRPRFPLREQWLHLRPPLATGDPLLDWLGCVHSADQDHVNSRIRGDDRPRGLALHSRPSLNVLNVAIGGGVPVMVWPRLPCPADSHDADPCTGRPFQQALDTEIAEIDGTVLSGLREAVMKLRLKARDKTAGDDPVYGRDVVIMWDDPERRPPAVLDKLR